MNCLVFFYLLWTLPKILWERICKGKRHPALLQRFGFGWPKLDPPVLWIHAVSLGEVKAAFPLFQKLKKKYPKATFLITTTTATGQKEAKRLFPKTSFFAYLPIDFSFVVKRIVKRVQPNRFILVESDIWPNLLKVLQKNNVVLSLVSAKMSKKSFKRFSYFPAFSKRLFSRFDHICVQNEEYQKRFRCFSEKVYITGNLKKDLLPQKFEKTIELPSKTITISCTHEPEEELIIEQLLKGDWFLVLAPRHPERFRKVQEFLAKKSISFSLFSDFRPGKKVLLVDCMGKLPLFYSQSELCILGGSFIPYIGGHNPLEPCLYGCPVFFGPFMENQKELAQKVIDKKAGKQMELGELRKEVNSYFHEFEEKQSMKQNALQILAKLSSVAQKTLEQLLNHDHTTLIS